MHQGLYIRISRYGLNSYLVICLILSSISVPTSKLYAEPGGQDNCQSCQKGGAGGGEGGGGGGGGGGAGAAEVLFGLAAIVAAASPAVAAAMQSEADQNIAKTNAQTQQNLALINYRTQMHLSNQQKTIALEQAAVARDIAAQNQYAATQRLDSQLAELKSAREDAAKFNEADRQFKQNLELEKIAIAKKQSEDAVAITEKQVRLQLSLAGLDSGISRSTTAGSAALTRTIAPNNSVLSSLAANQVASTGATSTTGATTGTASTASTSGSTGLGSALGVRSRSLSSTSRAIASVNNTSERTQRLVASAALAGEKDSEEDVLVNGKKNARGVTGKKPASRARGAIGSSFASTSLGISADARTLGRALGQAMTGNKIVRGSTSGKRVRIALLKEGSSSSDLNSFTRRTVQSLGSDDDLVQHASKRGASSDGHDHNHNGQSTHGRGAR